MTGPGRRVLHVCYCCRHADEVAAFGEAVLGLHVVMQTPLSREPGATLGMDREIESRAVFVYDHRGPRISPAIEIQEWVDPPIAGAPMSDPFAVGIQALGFAGASVTDAVGAGCTVVGSADGWTTLRDPRGVTLDVVEGEPRMAHLRATVTDLDRSIDWYTGLGCSLVGTGPADASALGVEGEGRTARLVLPDELFEFLLYAWESPASHGRHPAEPYHAGLWRVAVGVDDTREAYEAMLAEGWEFDRAPTAISLQGTPVPTMWICFLSDPDGIPFEFVQRPRAAFARR
jgi:catechol 2,3-dioxygenase-like lactoylglutathione lyase family enzyme